MTSPQETTTSRVHLAQEYARFCQARTALGTAWAGLIALWPFVVLVAGPPPPVFPWVQVCSNLMGLWAMMLWIGGRVLLGRCLYQPFGRARMRPEAGEARWNVLATLLLVAVALWELGWHWKELTSIGTIPLRWFLVREILVQALWMAQVAWVGWRCLMGWEDRFVFLWLGILGLNSLTWFSSLPSPLLGIGWMAALLLAPFLLVRGFREHRRFRSLVAEIRALPAVEA